MRNKELVFILSVVLFSGLVFGAGGSLINTTTDATPFWTNSTTNPVNISLAEGESEIVTFWVKPTGAIGTGYTFFGFVNSTIDGVLSAVSEFFTITISDLTYPLISFVSPTPDNATVTGNTSVIINTSITEANLKSVDYNWNGTNTSFYDDSLVLMMNFDNRSSLGENSSKVVDVSKYGNNGTINGGAIFNSTGGKYSGAYSFDGSNDYISTSFTPPNIFSISLWFKGNPSMTSNRGLFSTYSTSNFNGIYVTTDGFPTINIATDGNTFNNINYSFNANQWYNLAFVSNGSKIFVYVNGNLTNSIADTTTHKDTLIIGSSRFNLKYWNGSIDEVRIWNRSLTASEVSQLYKSNLAKYSDTEWNLQVNQSNLSNGVYTYQSFATDVAGNSNSTDLRYLTKIDSNHAPENPVVFINSTLGGNTSSENLNCMTNLSDSDGDSMNVSVVWYKLGFPVLEINYTNNYANGTNFVSSLSYGNLTRGEGWKCGVRTYDGELFSNWANSSEIEILNSKPTVELSNPPANNVTLERVIEFSWNGNDVDSDSLIYSLNITCYNSLGGGCSDDNRLIEDLETESYTPLEFNYFSDDNYYYNWTVRASDDSGVTWTNWTTPRKFEIGTLVMISLPNNTINFGSMIPGETKNTTTDSPLPFLIQNDGNSYINISLNATPIWALFQTDSDYFKYKIDENPLETGSFNTTLSQTDWAQMPISSISGNVIARLNWNDLNDSAQVDLLVEAPVGEPEGAKGSVVYFTASLG